MAANLLSLARVGMILAAIALFGSGTAQNILALFLVALAFFADAVDGWVARKLGTASVVGGILDVAADRASETLCWFYFAAAGLVPFWIPVVILLRAMATDTIRAAAAAAGVCLSGDKPALESRIGRTIIGSPFFRGGYALVKAATFIVLGLVIMTGQLPPEIPVKPGLIETLNVVGYSLVYLALAFCLVRAVPVLWVSRKCFGELHAA